MHQQWSVRRALWLVPRGRDPTVRARGDGVKPGGAPAAASGQARRAQGWAHLVGQVSARVAAPSARPPARPHRQAGAVASFPSAHPQLPTRNPRLSRLSRLSRPLLYCTPPPPQRRGVQGLPAAGRAVGADADCARARAPGGRGPAVCLFVCVFARAGGRAGGRVRSRIPGRPPPTRRRARRPPGSGTAWWRSGATQATPRSAPSRPSEGWGAGSRCRAARAAARAPGAQARAPTQAAPRPRRSRARAAGESPTSPTWRTAEGPRAAHTPARLAGGITAGIISRAGRTSRFRRTTRRRRLQDHPRLRHRLKRCWRLA